MFRRAFRDISAAALVGLVALRVASGLIGGALALLFTLAWVLLKLVCIGGAVYFTLTLVSPASAQRVREWLGIDEAPRAS